MTLLSFDGEDTLYLAQPKLGGSSSCRLSVTAYSMLSQLPFINGGRSSINNLRRRLAVVIGTILWIMMLMTMIDGDDDDDNNNNNNNNFRPAVCILLQKAAVLNLLETEFF
jgi:hypothetical protein